MKKILILLFVGFSLSALSQTGIGTTTPYTKLQVGNQPIHRNSRVWDANTPLALFHPTVTSNTVLNDPKPVLILGRDGTSGEAYGALATFNLSRYENSSTNSRTRLDIALTKNNFVDANVMTLLSSGNVGIGTSSPRATLNVTNDISNNSEGNTIPNAYGGNATTTLVLGHGVTGLTPNYWGLNLGTLYNGKSYLQGSHTNGSSFYDILLNPNGGNVGIGTSSPVAKLDIVGNVNANDITANDIIANAFIISSDKRFKKDIKPIASSLDNILKLRGTSYKFRIDEFEDKNFSSNLQYGFIAQELKEIFPHLVNTDKDGFLSVNYTAITPVLVEAIKEQQVKIELLEKQILEIKTYLKSLDNK
jgi:hypothetical protein